MQMTVDQDNSEKEVPEAKKGDELTTIVTTAWT